MNIRAMCTKGDNSYSKVTKITFSPYISTFIYKRELECKFVIDTREPITLIKYSFSV